MRIPTRKPGQYSNLRRDPHMTQAKFDELREQLRRLEQSQPGAAAEVKRLAEMGDFSENAAYQLSKGRLRGINQRILEIKDHLNQAQIISVGENSETIQLGSVVTFEQAGKQRTFRILGPTETNPSQGIISNKSPIGAALMGKQVGETITLQFADKEIKISIVKVE